MQLMCNFMQRVVKLQRKCCCPKLPCFSTMVSGVNVDVTMINYIHLCMAPFVDLDFTFSVELCLKLRGESIN
jgi:hypothetical protein